MGFILHGATGKMGKMVEACLLEKGHFISFGIAREQREHALFPILSHYEMIPEKNDICIDFSTREGVREIAKYCKIFRIPLLVGTTGLTEEDMDYLREVAKEIPLAVVSNTSLGVYLVNRLLEKAMDILDDGYDIELFEKHHAKKLDAPSGTANTMLSTIKKKRDLGVQYGRMGMEKRGERQIGVHSMRAGGIFGEHSIFFCEEDEIIEIKHTALSRRLFAKGAVRLALSLKEKPVGFYQEEDLF